MLPISFRPQYVKVTMETYATEYRQNINNVSQQTKH